MSRTRVKMCGMTRKENVSSACDAGADAIGMVFYPPSPRFVEIAGARDIARSVSPLVDLVTLFVDADEGFVREVIQETEPDYIQFHGQEPASECQKYGLPYIKAIRVKDEASLLVAIDQHREADALLLDAYVEGLPGGTGTRFDWALIPDSLADRIILAGGLTPANVSDAIQAIRPYAVDVSGGIEQTKGVKSDQKINAFMKAVQQADFACNEKSS